MVAQPQASPCQKAAGVPLSREACLWNRYILLTQEGMEYGQCIAPKWKATRIFFIQFQRGLPTSMIDLKQPWKYILSKFQRSHHLDSNLVQPLIEVGSTVSKNCIKWDTFTIGITYFCFISGCCLFERQNQDLRKVLRVCATSCFSCARIADCKKIEEHQE